MKKRLNKNKKDKVLSVRVEGKQLNQLIKYCDKKTMVSSVIQEMILIFNTSEDFRSVILKKERESFIRKRKTEAEKREYNRKRQLAYRNKNELNKLKHNLRTRTYLAFKKKRYNKNSSTEKMLGASYEVVHKHIESQFTDGMTWKNYGIWHIDHIIPLASAKNKKDLETLSHYTNLQPLWAEDNISKGSKMPSDVGNIIKRRETVSNCK